MTDFFHPQLHQHLQTHSDESLARSIALMDEALARREQELERVRAEAEDIRKAVAVAREVAAARRGLQDESFVARWRELLDTTSRAQDRYDRLDAALNEFMDDRRCPFLRTAWTVRQDNRQAILALFPHQNPVTLERTYQALLSLLPVLVNEANPDESKQGAVLSVISRDQSDTELVTLVAHPRLNRYELLRSWRHEEELEHRCETLREMLDYVAEKHPYYTA